MPQAGVVPPTPAVLPVAPHSVTRRATFEGDADAFMGAWVGHRTDLIGQASNAFDNANRSRGNADEALVSAGLAAGSQAAADQARLDAQTASGQALNAPGTQATSVSVQTLAPGAMTLTVQTGKAFTPGQFVVVAATAALGNAGFGQVASYVTGTGVLIVQVATFVGVSASYSAWSVTAGGQNQLAAALAQLPNLEPTLVMDFVRGGVPSAMNAAGGACRLLGRNQQYRDAAANSADVDFDVAPARCRGLLVESARSFVALWSSDLTNAAWQASDVSAAVLATPTFRGEPLYTVTKSNTVTSAYRRQLLPNPAAGESFVSTFAVLANTSTQLEFALYASAVPIGGINGDSQASILVGPGTLSQITGARWTITGLSTTVPTFVRVRRHFPSADTGFGIYFYPDLTSSTTSGAGVLIGRVAVERGTGITTDSSYTRSTSSIVTRAADVYTLAGADFSDFWNPEQGTIAVSYTGVGAGLTIDNGTAGEAITLGNNATTAYAVYTAGGVQQAYAAMAISSSTLCVALSYRAGQFWASVNGGAAVNAGSGVALGAKSRLVVGSNTAGGAQIDGGIKAVVYYPRAVTALECAASSNYWRAS